MSGKTTNVLLCGVGGQGVLLASEVLSAAAMLSGRDVKKSEVHGMAQRGGAVTSHVRWGEKVYSPLIEVGTADAILSFEPGEALRWSHYLSPEGVVLTAKEPIYSVLVSSGVEAYPEDVVERLEERCGRLVAVDALEEVKALGNPRAVNILLLGMLSVFVDIPEDRWREAIEARVPPKTVESNLRAFRRGRELANK